MRRLSLCSKTEFRMATSRSSSLDSQRGPKASFIGLAAELLDLIFGRLASAADFLAIALTCRRFHQHIEPTLYRVVICRNAKHLQSFHNSITNNPARADMVHTFRVKRLNDYYRNDHCASTDSELSDFALLPLLTKLQNLELETFYLDCDEFDKIFYAAARGEILRCLKTCILCFGHFNGETVSLWDCGTVFMHPTLKSLTMFNIGDGTFDRSNYKPSTTLQRLELLNSDISVRGLAEILSVTPALKELIIHASQEYYPPLECAPADSESYIAALDAVAPSLEKLVIFKDNSFGNRPMQLQKMTALRYVSIAMEEWFGYLCKNPESVTADMLKASLPPNLEVLEVCGWGVDREFVDEPLAVFLRPMFRNMSTLAPKLKQIYLPSGKVSPEFERACEDVGFPISRWSDEEEDEPEEDRGFFISSAALLSLPISYID